MEMCASGELDNFLALLRMLLRDDGVLNETSIGRGLAGTAMWRFRVRFRYLT